MTISDERHALEAIERIIRDNIVENDGPNRMKIGDDWHQGPVVDATFRMLRGLQQIASTGLSAIEQDQEPVAWQRVAPDGTIELTRSRSTAAGWDRSENFVRGLYASPSVCEGKVTEDLAKRAFQAVLSCPHTITGPEILLKYDVLKPGKNAADQLNQRIAAALTQEGE